MLYWKPFIFNIFVLCVAIKYTILSTAVWHKYSVAVRPSDPATPKYGAGPADVSGHLDQDQGVGHSTCSTQPSKPVLSSISFLFSDPLFPTSTPDFDLRFTWFISSSPILLRYFLRTTVLFLVCLHCNILVIPTSSSSLQFRSRYNSPLRIYNTFE